MSAHEPHPPESSAAGHAEAYLNDLDRALTAADPRERQETLTEVGEQLHEAVAEDNDGTQVRRTIQQLGSVDAIAAAATPADPQPPAAPPGQPKDWFVIGTTIASGVAMVTTVVFFPLAAIMALVTFVLGIVQLFTSKMGRMLPALSIMMSTFVLVLTAIAIIGITAWFSGVDDSGSFIEESVGDEQQSS